MLEVWKGRWFKSITIHMKMFWCSKCGEGVQADLRQKRQQTRGWICPKCKTGLPRKPLVVIEEEEAQAERLIARLRA